MSYPAYPRVREVVYARLVEYDILLDVLHFRPAADLDGVPFATAELVIAFDAAVWAAVEPRVDPPPTVEFTVTQYAPDGTTVLSSLPHNTLGNNAAELHVRTATRNWKDGQIVIQLAGGEARLDDERRVAATTVNTGATTVDGLCSYALLAVFGGAATRYDLAVMSEAIPAGDRRLMLQGETYAELIQPELDAIGARLIDVWGRGWCGFVRSVTYGPQLRLATHRANDTTYDPIVVDIAEVISRDGDWYDGVLVEYAPPGGTRTFQASTGGSSRALLVTRDRSAPSSNAANSIKGRAVDRGHTITVVCRNRYDIALADVADPRPQLVVIRTRDGDIIATIRAVEWDTTSGQMTLTCQTGIPE